MNYWVSEMREICKHCGNAMKKACIGCVWVDQYPTQYDGLEISDMHNMMRITTPKTANNLSGYNYADIREYSIRWARQEMQRRKPVAEITDEDRLNPFVFRVSDSCQSVLESKHPEISQKVWEIYRRYENYNLTDWSDVIYKKGNLIITTPSWKPFHLLTVFLKGCSSYQLSPKIESNRKHLKWILSATKAEVNQLVKRVRLHYRQTFSEGMYPCKVCGAPVRYNKHYDSCTCLVCKVFSYGNVWEEEDTEWEALE